MLLKLLMLQCGATPAGRIRRRSHAEEAGLQQLLLAWI
jgi:hypothetical protein